jgi:hypothetical protein
MHLFTTLFPGSDQQEGHPVSFIVFPGSGANPPKAAKQAEEIKNRLWELSQAENISELADVMASGQTYAAFRAAGNTLINSQTRRNILKALIDHGKWHFYHDSAYNIVPPGKTPQYIKWIEWAKARR